METTITTKRLDHLGLVSGMYDELGIGEKIDFSIKQDLSRRELSLGTLCKALVLNDLGFTQHRLYMVYHFFEDKPIAALLGASAEASQLNDTVLERALDQLHTYGTTELFSALVTGICQTLNLMPKFGHMDSTDFHLEGAYNAAEPPEEDSRIMHLTKGYSRDHRPDLNQVVLNLIADNEAGIPLHMEALSGNSSDKTDFRQTIKVHVSRLQNVVGLSCIVMDSADYTEQTLLECLPGLKWISRVPESIKSCKSAINDTDPFQPLNDRYALPFAREPLRRRSATLADITLRASVSAGSKDLTKALPRAGHQIKRRLK